MRCCLFNLLFDNKSHYLFIFSRSYYNVETKSYRVVKYKGQEEVYVDKVVLCNSHSEWGNGDTGLEETTSLVKICVTLRIPVSDLVLLYLFEYPF